jgi:hypothetical protein
MRDFEACSVESVRGVRETAMPTSSRNSGILRTSLPRQPGPDNVAHSPPIGVQSFNATTTFLLSPLSTFCLSVSQLLCHQQIRELGGSLRWAANSEPEPGPEPGGRLQVASQIEGGCWGSRIRCLDTVPLRCGKQGHGKGARREPKPTAGFAPFK